MTTDVRVLPVSVPVSPERVTPLRPSEALRLGRLTVPVRLTGRYQDYGTGACAVGAIAIGAGLPTFFLSGDVERRFPGLNVGDVAFRNDSGWSDDQIVAWLESLGL